MHEPHARIRSAAARADAAPTRALVIADDSAEVRARIRDALAAEFTEVVEAADGRQLVWTLLRAEVCARTGRPRLVIADLCLPGYDGLEVLEAWRAEYPDSALLLLTALPSARVHASSSRRHAASAPKNVRRAGKPIRRFPTMSASGSRWPRRRPRCQWRPRPLPPPGPPREAPSATSWRPPLARRRARWLHR